MFCPQLICFLFFLGSSPIHCSEESIVVECISNETQGTFYYAIYRSKENFLSEEKFFRSGKYQVKSSKTSFSISLPKGEYALTVFQDLNGNGKMDKNWLGIPKEPYGFSNNPKMSFGPPSFKDSIFEVFEGQKITIQVKS